MNHPERAPKRRRARAANGLDEVGAAIKGELRRSAARITEHAVTLESIGSQSIDAEPLSEGATSGELVRHAQWLHALVRYGWNALAELQAVAGRLDVLASLRASQEAEKESRK